jgi:hypothetical protein
MKPSFETMFALVGRIVGQPPDHPEVRLLTTMIFGQVSVFRTNRAAALRMIGWQHFGPDEQAQIRAVGRRHIHSLFESQFRRPKRPPRRRARRRRA